MQLSISNSLFVLTWSAVHCMKSVQIRSFFWSVFYRIWTEYGDTRSISPYSVQMRENTDQKKLRIRAFFTLWRLVETDHFWYFVCIGKICYSTMFVIGKYL